MEIIGEQASSRDPCALIDAALTATGPEKPFLVTGAETLRYGELADRLARLYSVFAEMGLASGDRVVIAAADDAATATLTLAAMRAGLTAVVGDPRTTRQELARLLAAADPRAVFIDAALLARCAEGDIPPGAEVVAIGPRTSDGAASVGLAGRPPRHLDTRNLGAFAAIPAPAVVPADAVALMVFTSGTTTRPKGVQLTHHNLAAQLATFRSVYGFDAESRILNVLPLHHVDGLIRGPLASLCAGATLHRPASFSVPTLPRILDCVAAARITHFITVPAMLAIIDRLGADRADRFRGPDFRFVISSADLLHTALWRRFEARFEVTVVNAYGLSETVCDALFCGPHGETRRVGTLGRPAGCEARIVDDAGREVPPGETGELILRGGIVMKGYFRQPEATAAVLRDGWFHTGDLASVDDKGFFVFAGRKKSAIVSRGVTIHPENVTSAVLAVPGVTEAVTLGVADEACGERVVCCVVADPAGGVDATAVFAACRSALPPEKQPDEVHFLESLPRGPAGKVLLEAVRQALAESPPRSAPAAAGTDEVRDAALPTAALYALAAETFKTTPEALSPASTPYNTPGWDSLAHLTFVAAIEERFAIKLTAAQVIGLVSLADAENIIRATPPGAQAAPAAPSAPARGRWTRRTSSGPQA